MSINSSLHTRQQDVYTQGILPDSDCHEAPSCGPHNQILFSKRNARTYTSAVGASETRLEEPTRPCTSPIKLRTTQSRSVCFSKVLVGDGELAVDRLKGDREPRSRYGGGG